MISYIIRFFIFLSAHFSNCRKWHKEETWDVIEIWINYLIKSVVWFIESSTPSLALSACVRKYCFLPRHLRRSAIKFHSSSLSQIQYIIEEWKKKERGEDFNYSWKLSVRNFVSSSIMIDFAALAFAFRFITRVGTEAYHDSFSAICCWIKPFFMLCPEFLEKHLEAQWRMSDVY